MIAVLFVAVSSVAYVIPNAQAVEPAEEAVTLAELTAQVSEPVASEVLVSAVTRETYGVTLPPPPPPPPPPPAPTRFASSGSARSLVGATPSSSSAELRWPLPGGTPIGSPFGPRGGRMHEGLDMNPGSGVPVTAIANGVVIETNAPGYSAYGVHVRVQHIIDGQLVVSLYAHFQEGTMPFSVGDQVSVGQVLGNVGCTGRCTGAHLHFEIRPGGGAAVDPVAWMQSKLG